MQSMSLTLRLHYPYCSWRIARLGAGTPQDITTGAETPGIPKSSAMPKMEASVSLLVA